MECKFGHIGLIKIVIFAPTCKPISLKSFMICEVKQNNDIHISAIVHMIKRND